MSKDERYDVSQHEGHTPGPWWLCCEDDTLYARWIQADEKSICSDLNEATEVDAQLLAATPEILDALKEAYDEIDKLRTVITTLDFEYGIAAKLLGEVEPASE
tara:strand:- start:595 stop:903 length:309 start_codon:yes stop_codon:yes gene_type:complete